MSNIRAILSIAGRVTQPSCSCARHRIGITADCCRPGGNSAILASAQRWLSAENAKLSGCSVASARRRTLIASQPSLRRSPLSPVDLAEDDVEGAENGGDVGQHVAAAEEIHGAQMRKARSFD